jgi:hypothetical protein
MSEEEEKMFWSKQNTEKSVSGAARGVSVVLAIFALLAFGDVSASAQDVGTDAYVNMSGLNLREAPDTGASTIRVLPSRTVVSILERRGAWARVFVRNTGAGPVEGWLTTRFLGWDAKTMAELTVRENHGRGYGTRHLPQSYDPIEPLRVSKIDFDCKAPIFGNSGIKKCGASARVQLMPEEYDPDRSDIVPIACRGAITYQTENNQHTQRIVAVQSISIARNDRLGQSAKLDFDVRSIRDKINSAQLLRFSCVRDYSRRHKQP